jgi:hypothetical protein
MKNTGLSDPKDATGIFWRHERSVIDNEKVLA